ncbi:UV-damage endonuclease [Histoplasma capsulatum]|uniref:UV-damage endonuclease n=1 Tax=Ajellomyces capsulatus TaxID=5037 RepID=A0A8A1MEA4_AJECA|nr:UV-damage endonuclease [Histoplasma capsulatum]
MSGPVALHSKYAIKITVVIGRLPLSASPCREGAKQALLQPTINGLPVQSSQTFHHVSRTPDLYKSSATLMATARGMNSSMLHTTSREAGIAQPAPASQVPLDTIEETLAYSSLSNAPFDIETSLAGVLDPEADVDIPADIKDVKEAVSRPPPVNSNYLPLPWKGRLGYACLNTYLRTSNPPVFCARTCRISSILENRHPLQDPTQPAHRIKNRPDLQQPPDIERGLAYVQSLGLANARDIVKILRWNERYGIKFMRLSSEMFPFASHVEHGYRLEPFASDVLAEAGRVAAELGHRLTVHPGQFTQLSSPRPSVTENSVRDLEYHAEMLRLLKLPPQQDRDAVMILHMGGVFGDKQATLDRFRKTYRTLSGEIKNRLVLENDDVSWTVHDLLPICEELNIPLVLDYHHHNINFAADKVREGTLDIMTLYDRIAATWARKGITQKMHYSEQTPSAITQKQRRKHSSRVQMLPPCDPTMDLMIEAKDKEQAVFELMRIYKLPGFEKINDIIPFTRSDDNKFRGCSKKKTKKTTTTVKKSSSSPSKQQDPVASDHNNDVGDSDDTTSTLIPEEEVGMGGPEGRVYWPPGMDQWLQPAKRASKVDIAETIVAQSSSGTSALLTSTPTTPRKRGRPSKSKDAAAAAKSIAGKLAASKRPRPGKIATLSSSGSGSDSDSNQNEIAVGPAATEKEAPATCVSGRTRGRKVNYAEEGSA